MNPDTGRVYVTEEEINAARKRGEPLEPIGPRVAELDKHGVPYVNQQGRVLSRKERRAKVFKGKR
jgi:hypothetical protein